MKKKPDHDDSPVWQKTITCIIDIFLAPMVPIMSIIFYITYYIGNMLPYTANIMIFTVVVAIVIHAITLLYIYVILLLHSLGMLQVIIKQYY